MKKKNWFVRMVAILMAVLMLLSVLFIAVGTFRAGAVSQSQIDGLKQQQKTIESKKKEIQSQINSYEYQQKSALAKKQVLDSQIDLTQQEINDIDNQIQTYTQLIEDKKVEVTKAQDNEDKQLTLFKSRLRTMEENGTISYLAVIFNANSFSDLLARIDFVEEISQYDNQVYQNLKAARKATQDAKTALENDKADQESQKQSLQQKQSELSSQVKQATDLINQYETSIQAAKDLYEQEAAAAQSIQSDINSKVAELQREQQQGKSVVVGTGQLTWPAPSCMVVTSPFGMRFHPIYKAYKMHYGVDIGVSYGSNIVAADAGTVITSAYDSSYGNYIVISHGNGMTTLYAHLSQRLVSVGAGVTKGQLIAKSGSTGDSTGPHLHFEVSLNGTRVNPLNYFSGYTTNY